MGVDGLKNRFVEGGDKGKDHQPQALDNLKLHPDFQRRVAFTSHELGIETLNASDAEKITLAGLRGEHVCNFALESDKEAQVKEFGPRAERKEADTGPFTDHMRDLVERVRT